MPMTSSATRRYAEAAFQIATGQGKVDEWQRDLRAVAELAGDSRLARAVDSPAAPFDERRRVVEQVLGNRVSREVVNLALLLSSRERFATLPSVAHAFDALVRQSRGIVAATVISSAPLSDDELAAVRRRVEQLAGENVELSTQIDPSLIGGLVVRIGDRQIDASVRGRLERLRERLVQGTA